MSQRRVGNVVVNFPDSMSEEEIQAAMLKLPDALKMPQDVNQPVAAHRAAAPLTKITPAQSHRDTSPRETGLGVTDPTPPAARANSLAGRMFGTEGGYGQYGPASQLMRDAYQPTEANTQFRQQGPGAAALLASLLTSGLASIPAAGAAGGGAALLRGDSPKEALKVGGWEAATEAVPGLVKEGLGRAAKWTAKGVVDPAIARKFPNVDIPQQILDYGAFPGSATSARRIEGLSQAANAGREAAMTRVPSMNAVQVIQDYRAPYQKAVSAGKTDRAQTILDEAKKTIAEVQNTRGGQAGRNPTQTLDPKGQLDRASISALEGKAAINNPAQAAILPDLMDAERAAISRNIHTVPEAGAALDKSQALMALDKVMKSKQFGTTLNTAKLPGLVTSVATSPIGVSTAAHALNVGRHAVDPNVVRALHMLMSSHGTTQPPDEEP